MNHTCCLHASLPKGFYWFGNILIDSNKSSLWAIQESEWPPLVPYQLLEIRGEPGNLIFLITTEKETDGNS